MSIIFGIAAAKGVLTGCYIQDISWGSTCSIAEAMNEEGEIVQTDAYGKKKTFTANATVNGDCSLEAGDKLTIDGTEYTINSAMFKESSNGHKTFSVSGSAPFNPESGA